MSRTLADTVACAPQGPDPRPGYYYVSAVRGERYALARGPFASHDEAIAAVDEARETASALDPLGAGYASWGTCRSESDLGPGLLDAYEAGGVP